MMISKKSRRRGKKSKHYWLVVNKRRRRLVRLLDAMERRQGYEFPPRTQPATAKE